MRLRRRPDAHARYRELLSAQMDVPLHLDEAWQLTVHLARCDGCRAAEREFKKQRRALRSLPAVPAPRDLWARTSAALDDEMASRRPSFDTSPAGRLGERHPESPASGRSGRAGRGASGASIAASLAVFGAAAMLVMSQWPLLDSPSPTSLRPTPFAVPGQALAFLGSGPQGMSIFRTSIDHFCPATAADCVNEHAAPAAMALSAPIEASTLALSPSGRQLAITGRDRDRDSVVAIVTLPDPDPQPATTPAALPSPAAGATEVASSVRPTEPGPTAEPEGPSTPAASGATSGTADPAATAGPVEPSAAPGLAVVAILEDALGAGAPPAWSSDGGMLAFSAMPVDGRHGPDLYVWRPGDEVAQRLTDDHTTYFASWAGAHIVVSRVTGATDSGAPVPATMVIDPLTAAEREVDGVPIWLPQVNAPLTHAIAWHGTLAWRDEVAVPDSGMLYVVDWQAFDPLAEPPAAPQTQAPESPDPADPDPATTGTPGEPAGEPTEEPSGAPTGEPLEPGDQPTEASPSPAVEGTSQPAARATFQITLPAMDDDGDDQPATEAPPGDDPPDDDAGDERDDDQAGDAPSPSLPAGDLAALLRPVEPARDQALKPVRDWEVRWSPGGALVGLWIADVPGSSWGRLAVLPLDAEAGELAAESPLLAPTLARRSFALGDDRVAWVGPADHSPEGELRVTAWGPDGFGMLRVSAPEVDGAVAPF